MLFTREFLEELQSKCGAKSMLDSYMEKGMSFEDSILRLANFHSLKPEYVYPGYSESDKSILLLIDTLKKNIEAKNEKVACVCMEEELCKSCEMYKDDPRTPNHLPCPDCGMSQ